MIFKQLWNEYKSHDHVNIDKECLISPTFNTIDKLIESKVNENNNDNEKEENVKLSVNSYTKMYSDY